ncbi:hypothetical protein NLJ89_g2212 [Agrocybe chaxingu]|uniref:Methyltransferase-domain-containing protein n=1 Tax=Agrocybe chaxingu TaxID=84603 RepID=A0A9W8MWP4_9AGAR|nr:hypothetical protein NLJ89_g2212 [Agrocybe chaxingu]
MPNSELESEDFLFDSLQTLYDYQPITLTTSGAPFTYTVKLSCHPLRHQQLVEQASGKPVTIELHTPDTEAANWALHASSIWVSSIYLADHISELDLEAYIDSHPQAESPVHVLELGASAGLPSILISRLYPELMVTVTDYPDEVLIKTLSDNVARNGVAQQCKALPYAWGSDPAPILGQADGFDVVFAADTLWNPDFHGIFIKALKLTLKKSPSARIHLVVGLHTGRYTIQAFLNAAMLSGFELESIQERETTGCLSRNWELRDNEDEKERRRWVIWIQLKWTREALALQDQER